MLFNNTFSDATSFCINCPHRTEGRDEYNKGRWDIIICTISHYQQLFRIEHNKADSKGKFDFQKPSINHLKHNLEKAFKGGLWIPKSIQLRASCIATLFPF